MMNHAKEGEGEIMKDLRFIGNNVEIIVILVIFHLVTALVFPGFSHSSLVQSNLSKFIFQGLRNTVQRQ